MAQTLFNVSPGLLILPSGVEILPGMSIDLPEEFAANEGVASWIADGLASDQPPPAALQDELTVARAERDALASEVDELRAQLEAATAPSKGK